MPRRENSFHPIGWLAAALFVVVGTTSPAFAQEYCAGPFDSTLDQHVSAGRAQLSPADCSGCFLGICGFPGGCETPASYTATGSGQALGQDGNLRVSLYEQPRGVFTTNACSTCSSFESNCSDGIDDDCDGVVDCSDSDCSGNSACCASSEMSCTNGSDDDCDGAVDCADSDCRGDSACCASSETSCGNGSDDDCDGAVDCADSDCASDPACATSEMKYIWVHGGGLVSADETNYGWSNASPLAQRWVGTAALHLPDGAQPQELKCGWDNAHEELVADYSEAIFFYSRPTTVVYSARGLLDLSGPANGREQRTVDISDMPPVDNEAYASGLFVRLWFASSAPPVNPSVDFYGCRVGYTMP